MTDRRRRDDVIRAIDLFCGAGGLSWGLAQACEELDHEVELAAVNHWETAIETHERNHSWADHYHARVEELDPREVFPGERVDILTAGPECTHFSIARGDRPVDDQKRASPWHVLTWLQKLYVDNFVIENVREFEKWGPVGANGQPMKSKEGETFDAFVNALYSLGYSVDWKVLNAADYGDATSRKRLFLVGRRQHRPEFPEPTHSENGTLVGTKSWRTAAEIIDWSDPGESIWGRDRPLVNNTMKRIAEGIRRHGSDDLTPYADMIADLTKADVQEMQQDVLTPTEAVESVIQRDEPFLVKYYGTSTAKSIDKPVDTITSGGQKFGLCVPYLLGQQSGSVARDVTERPVPTIATRGAIGLYRPQALVLPRNSYHRGLHSNPVYDPGEQPLHTVTAKDHDGHIVGPYLVPFYSERAGQAPRTHDITEPLPTITATGSQPAVTRPYLIQYHVNSGTQAIDNPLPTVTTRDSLALCLPNHHSCWGLNISFRMLQPRELAAAMGFLDDYEFAGTKTETVEQIGNAVPVNLAKSLCERLLAGRNPTLQTFFSKRATTVADGGNCHD